MLGENMTSIQTLIYQLDSEPMIPATHLQELDIIREQQIVAKLTAMNTLMTVTFSDRYLAQYWRFQYEAMELGVVR